MHWGVESRMSVECDSNLPEEAKTRFPVYYKAYKKACSLGSAGEYAIDVCWYRHVFAKYMRSMGVNYMSCCKSFFTT